MRLSIIVPLAPGEAAWRGLAAQLDPLLGAECELLLVAAGAPVQWTSERAVRLLACLPGRARQLNYGAAQAAGEWLWFLHADTRLSDAAWPALQRFMSRDAMAMGWFDLTFREDGPRLMRWNARGANLRSRFLGMPFGDQGFVLPKRLFDVLGGFDERAAYGEDHLLVWAARRAGYRVPPVGASLSTSARKYARHGWARTTGRHVWLTAVQAFPQFLAWRGRR